MSICVCGPPGRPRFWPKTTGAYTGYSAKNRWKEKAREREKKIKELGDVLEAAKGIAEELEDKLSIEQVKYIRMRDKLFKMQGELEKAAQDLEKYLTEIKKLKEKEYTLLESLVFLFKALRGVYNKWLMEQQSKS